MRFLRKVDDTGEPCESCGRQVWWWHSAHLADYPDSPGRWTEVPQAGDRVTMGVQHDAERCRWWRGDPSTSWGEPPESR